MANSSNIIKPGTYHIIPQLNGGYALNGKWSVTVGEGTTNLFLDPSWEKSLPNVSTNATTTAINSQAARGLLGLNVQPTIAAISEIELQFTLNGYLAINSNYTFSADLKGFPGERFKIYVLLVANTLGSKEFIATGEYQRESVTFTTPGALVGGFFFRIQKISPTTKVWASDGWQLEKKAYPTTYCDGDHGGVWQGQPNNSQSIRPANATSFGGRAYSFSDLGFVITDVSGGGIAPVNNISNALSLLGGAYYQRTTQAPRQIALTGTLTAQTPAELYKLKQALETLLQPKTAKQEGRPLLLRYQYYDDCGKPVGKPLQTPCYYVSGLEGGLTNNFQEKITLIFVDYNPPDTTEEYDKSSLLNYVSVENYVAATGMNDGQTFRQWQGGKWQRLRETTTNSAVAALAFARFDAKTSDTNTIAVAGTNSAGVVGVYMFDGNQQTIAITEFYLQGGAVTGGSMLALQATPTTLFAGGSFTGPQPYIRQYDPNMTASAVGATINAAVRSMCLDTNGNLLVVGDMTTPQAGCGRWNGTAWSALTLGAGLTGGVGRAIARMNATQFVIGGSFTTADGVAVNGVTIYNTNNALPFFSPLPATGSNIGLNVGGQVNAVAVFPNGSVVIAGTFSTAGGVACRNIALYNNNQFQPLGDGIGNSILGLCITPDGDLYIAATSKIVGDSTLPNNFNAPSKLFMWSGKGTTNGIFFPLDLQVINTGPSAQAIAYLSGNLLVGYNAVGAVTVGTPAYKYGELTTINYTGSADVFPRLVITGPGRLYQITNITTGKDIYFYSNLNGSYDLQTGETLAINFDPSNFSIISTLNGSVIERIRRGSDNTTFGLESGENILKVFIVGTTTSDTQVQLIWVNTHTGFDATNG